MKKKAAKKPARRATASRPDRRAPAGKAPRSAKPSSAPGKKKAATRKVARPPRRRAPARAELAWRAASPQHRTAAVAGGAYVLVSHDRVVWSAEWRPAAGKVERLCFREPLAAAEAACQRHRTLVAANALLVAADAAHLTGADVTGAAVAWKRGRR